MSPPSEAPIPMALPEALQVAEHLLLRLPDSRERRAVEQLIRHARTARRSASTATDMTGLLIATRDGLLELAGRLTAAIEGARG